MSLASVVHSYFCAYAHKGGGGGGGVGGGVMIVIKNKAGMVAQAFNLSTWEAEAGRFLRSRSTCST